MSDITLTVHPHGVLQDNRGRRCAAGHLQTLYSTSVVWIMRINYDEYMNVNAQLRVGLLPLFWLLPLKWTLLGFDWRIAPATTHRHTGEYEDWSHAFMSIYVGVMLAFYLWNMLLSPSSSRFRLFTGESEGDASCLRDAQSHFLVK